MLLLQRSIGPRLLSTASKISTARASATQARYESSTSTELKPTTKDLEALSAKDAETTSAQQEESAEAAQRHRPDYGASIDYRTSTFSPVPKRVMDGSEPGESVTAAVISGAPLDLQARTARIYRPAKTATQSGTWHGPLWVVDWDPLPKGHRWENPLMGWQSSADFMQGERIGFQTREDAIRFAEKQGYEYFVQEPNERKFVPKAYANNFMHTPKKLKIVRTK